MLIAVHMIMSMVQQGALRPRSWCLPSACLLTMCMQGLPSRHLDRCCSRRRRLCLF